MHKASLKKGDEVILTFPFHASKPEEFAPNAAEAFELFRRNTKDSLLDDDVTVVFEKV